MPRAKKDYLCLNVKIDAEICHRLTEVIAGSLDFFALQFQLVDNGILPLFNGLDLMQSDAPEVEDH